MDEQTRAFHDRQRRERAAAAEAACAALTRAQEFLDTYRWQSFRGQSRDMLEWFGEGHGRLAQLVWLVRRIEQLQVSADAGTPLVEPELEIMIEAFYTVAFRAARALQKLPDFHRFNPAGVRDVRNDLLEHTDSKRAQGPFISSHAFGGTEGPKLRVVRQTRQKEAHGDRGLYVNALEFATELTARVNRALSHAQH